MLENDGTLLGLVNIRRRNIISVDVQKSGLGLSLLYYPCKGRFLTQRPRHSPIGHTCVRLEGYRVIGLPPKGAEAP